jgi:hypothetical protein
VVQLSGKFVRFSATVFDGLVVLGMGAAKAQECHPDCSPCVPIASDVDCAGGNGNGPEYVTGPIYVTGDDTYQLDRDGNGIACEPQ